MEMPNDLVGFVPEKLQPTRVLARICNWTLRAMVAVVIAGAVLGDWRSPTGTSRVLGKLATPNVPLRHRIFEAPVIQTNDYLGSFNNVALHVFFRLGGPTAIAIIGSMLGTLADRSVRPL